MNSVGISNSFYTAIKGFLSLYKTLELFTISLSIKFIKIFRKCTILVRLGRFYGDF